MQQFYTIFKSQILWLKEILKMLLNIPWQEFCFSFWFPALIQNAQLPSFSLTVQTFDHLHTEFLPEITELSLSISWFLKKSLASVQFQDKARFQ